MLDSFLLVLPFFVVALLYASVGHGGASGYLAVMALLSIDPVLLRPTALVLNIVVSTLGTVVFFRAGHFSARLFWPLALSAVPFAYIGGSLLISDELFRKILGLALCVGLFRLFMPSPTGVATKCPSTTVLVTCGAAMGFCSGLIGVGGGIFLTPLVILMHWGSPKTAASISAPFILVNSIAGLAGLRPRIDDCHPELLLLALVVFVAGQLGTRWGSHIASSRQICYALATVLAFAVLKLFL